ncbi:MAG: MBL fold metallo-hydrolase [Thermodesulfobacteriota bacterium]
MDVTAFALGPLQTNGYLLEHAGRALFIDPGGDPAPVLAALAKRKPVLEAVVLTHLHFDHTYGVAALAKATGAPVLASPADAYLRDSWLGRGGEMGVPLVPDYAFAPLEPGDAGFLGLACRVLATPGHSPGSLTLYFPDAGAAFVGDLVFARSIGRTDFPGGDTDTLLASVRERIFTLPGDTKLYPGHGPATTVAAESAHNPFFAGVF